MSFNLDKLTLKIIFLIAAQIAREVEKAEKTRAKEASSISEASTSVRNQIIIECVHVTSSNS